jgi:tetratricopeptide (TPR) repeat protein
MAKNRLVVNHVEDSIQLSWQQGQAVPRSAPLVCFEHPFDENALSEIRWYLEQYIRFPYGIEPDKAAKVEQQFQVWGQQLFELVFRSSEEARGYFQEATREGLNHCELTISSDDPVVLNLPWELLYSPLDRSFLAPSLAGMYRSLSSFAVRAEMEGLPQDKLNILLVIARPYGERDIGLKTIARPMLEALKPIRQQLNLKVLRPPSFDELEQELNDHKGFYHIVHFDGHGNFDSSSQGFQHSFGSAGQGVLVFEDIDGSPQIVTAAQIAQSLTDCGVPIFVLNACKSAQEGSGSFSSVATRLVSLGAKGVVAMAYNVREEAAKHFIGRLYKQLVKGSSLDHAVAEGRKEILNHRLRSSPKGDLPLADWIVPVLYQQITYIPFTPNAEARKLPDLMRSAASASDRTAMIDLPEESAYGFIGRDYDILRLERAFRQNCVVLLQGMGGVGKTQLAGGFARWLAETQGRIGGIFFTSFEHGAGLSNVINQIGRALMGEEFSQYPFENQRLRVLEYLKANPSLLVWDNFEPVAGFPTGNEPLLPAEERESLKRFLKDLREGESWVLITSRREEPWLDCGNTLLNLHGLSQQDAEELAAKILQTAGVDRKKLPQEYLELLQLLGGHPLALRVILPYLKTQTPLQLIEALRQGLDAFKGLQEEGRDKSLTVSLDYSFTKLSERTRQHLPFLALFSERVNIDWLQAFSKSSEGEFAEFGQAYRAVFGENLQESDWLQILNEAAAAGILEYLGSNIYKIHPALPWYLRQQLAEAHSQEAIKELEKRLLRFYAGLAAYLREEVLPSEAEYATFSLIIEEPNLLRNLRFAEQEQDWQNAQAILQALGDRYMRLGRRPEFRSLRQRVLKKIGTHFSEAKAKGENAFTFWKYLRGVDAAEAFESGDIETSRLIQQEILDELTALNDPSVRHSIAVANIELGHVAQARRDFDTAIDSYQKGLKIFEEEKGWHNIAGVYHNLGVASQEKKDLDSATIYHQKAGKIYEDAGDLYNASTVYFELGLIAIQQQKFDLATQQLNKALEIREDLGDLERAANVYCHLGMVSRMQEKLDEATNYLHKALKIQEDAKDFYKAARTYLELGSVSFFQQNFDDAIAYYQKALEVYERLGSLEAFEVYHNLGVVSQTLRKRGNALEDQENFVDALKVYIQAFFIDSQYQPNSIRLDIENLGWMFYELGETQFDSIWQEIIGEECPAELRTEIRKFVADSDGHIVTLTNDIPLFMLRIARYQNSQEKQDK